MSGIEILGLARRRRWPDDVKLAILSEVNTNGWTLSDVARRHDVTRQHLYHWRRELRAKGRLDVERRDAFVPVEMFGMSEPLPLTRKGRPVTWAAFSMRPSLARALRQRRCFTASA